MRRGSARLSRLAVLSTLGLLVSLSIFPMVGTVLAASEAEGTGPVTKTIHLDPLGLEHFQYEAEIELHVGSIHFDFIVLEPAGAAVNFNIHYHDGAQTFVLTEKVGAEGHGEVHVDEHRVYFLHWVNTNHEKVDVKIHYEYHDLIPLDGTPIFAGAGAFLVGAVVLLMITRRMSAPRFVER